MFCVVLCKLFVPKKSLGTFLGSSSGTGKLYEKPKWKPGRRFTACFEYGFGVGELQPEQILARVHLFEEISRSNEFVLHESVSYSFSGVVHSTSDLVR